MSSSSSPALLSVLPDGSELHFKRPFSNIVKQSLTLKNLSSSDPLAFKIKTTAPKQYCVRPNSGKLRPGEALEVAILLQAMRDDPPLDFKCKDKFLIQALKVSNELFSSLEGDDAPGQLLSELWAQAELSKKDNGPPSERSPIEEHKLRVVFLPPDVLQTAPPSGLNPVSKLQELQQQQQQQQEETLERTFTAQSLGTEPLKTDTITGGAGGLRQRPSVSTSSAPPSKPSALLSKSKAGPPAPHLLLPSLLGSPSALPLEWAFLLALLFFLLGKFLA